MRRAYTALVGVYFPLQALRVGKSESQMGSRCIRDARPRLVRCFRKHNPLAEFQLREKCPMRICAIAVASAAAVISTLLPAASAAADESSTGDVKSNPVTAMLLTKAQSGINPTPPPDRWVVLGCHPTWSVGHPGAREACPTLDSVAGDFGELNVNPHGLCCKIYKPVTVTAQGWWRGKKVSYEKTFTNSCELQKTTGAVFAF
ncbi:SSI family serine proteinase inhibitor [Streptomyces sp. NPDC007205]|uniref:SSI family serine proteinase inhibitor n=1 Tax=Streptomyces sp. NPDC007205 TaxID=3154316 RepID=UPI0033FCAB68